MPELLRDDLRHYHMPFLYGDELLFSSCLKKDYFIEDQKRFHNFKTKTLFRPYEIYTSKIKDGKVIDIKSLVPHEKQGLNVLCNANKYKDEGEEVLTYTRENVAFSDRQFFKAYRLINGVKSPVKNLSGVKQVCVAENERFTAVSSSLLNETFIILHDKILGIERRIDLSGMLFLRRISFISGTNNLLLTIPIGKNRKVYETHVFDIHTFDFKRVKAEDKNIYKSTIFGKILVYTVKGESENYERYLKISDYELIESKLKAKIGYSIKRLE